MDATAIGVIRQSPIVIEKSATLQSLRFTNAEAKQHMHLVRTHLEK